LPGNKNQADFLCYPYFFMDLPAIGLVPALLWLLLLLVVFAPIGFLVIYVDQKLGRKVLPGRLNGH
jgi:hypothetical protein